MTRIGRTALDESAEAARSFNRYLVRRIGILDEYHLYSRFSLTQARILYELAHAPGHLTATHLRKSLSLDAGYLSRILETFGSERLITRRVSSSDARQVFIQITRKGRTEYAALNQVAHDHMVQMLVHIPSEDLLRMIAAMETIRNVLG